MAKKNKDEKEKKNGGGGFLTFIIILLILLIWLAILALLIKFDVGGIGSRYLRPYLKDVPVINRILPDISPEDEARENAYPYKNMEEMMNRIKELEKQVDIITEENNDLSEENVSLHKEVDILQHFEDEHEEFAKRVREFDRNVVYNDKAPSTNEYMKYYEGIYPKNAAEIYTELLRKKEKEKNVEAIAQ